MKINTRTSFRLYKEDNSVFESTLFDMISAGKEIETKQTKGLAYVISIYPSLIADIINSNKIKDKIVNRRQLLSLIKKSDYIRVDTEMLSDPNFGKRKRRDIAIGFFNKNKKILLIVLEAKSILQKSTCDIEGQLDSYFDERYFPGNCHIPKLGIALTREHHILANPDYVNITWEDLISILYNIAQTSNYQKNKLFLLEEYLKFLISVAGDNLEFYEVEVLSVGAGSTIDLIKKHYVYDCPDNHPSYKYPKPIFMAFRQEKGGAMDYLYKVADILSLDPLSNSLDEILETYPEKERIIEYIKERDKIIKRDYQGNYRFYILSRDDQIPLTLSPKLKNNNPGGRYISLASILTQKEVEHIPLKKVRSLH